MLVTLPDEHLAPLCPSLERCHTRPRDIIHHQHAPIRHVYFPCSGALSNLVCLQDGSAIEIGTVGNEGFSAVALLAGARIATETCVCQIEGDNLRMSADSFRQAVLGDTPLRHVSDRYFQGYLMQVAQSAACNRKHSLEARFARWLLLTHDRVQGREFLLTQEFLAEMLGVQRPSVSLVAAGFQKQGVIRYNRGHMTILDRATLEDESCECYALVRDQFRRVLGTPATVRNEDSGQK